MEVKLGPPLKNDHNLGWRTSQGLLTPVRLAVRPKKDGKAFFLHGGDPRRYDSSLEIRILFSWNDDYPHCLENMLLSSTASDIDKLGQIAAEVERFVQTLDAFHAPATGIQLVTKENNRLTLKVFQDTEVLHSLDQLPEIPPSLSALPVAPTTDLTKIESISYDVDLVSWADKQYAFKKTTCGEDMLSEIEALHRLRDCTAVNPPIALVVNDNAAIPREKRRIRGFLALYMPGGTLETLFRSRTELSATGSLVPIIPWLKKLTWVIELTRVVLTMHSTGICKGDLRPGNVLLDGRGGVRLVGFALAGPTAGWGAPEHVAASDQTRLCMCKVRNLDQKGGDSLGSSCDVCLSAENFDFARMLTPAMDVYGLGAIMWALGEEKADGLEMRTWGLSPPWYRDIAEWCLAEDPVRRPSSSKLLLRLVVRHIMLLRGP